MSNKVVVVDYGIGNVFSVCNALKLIGADPILTRSETEIKSADRLILPGVGAYARAMEALQKFGLVDLLSSYRETGRPFMGICIGMQVLMELSEEFGEHKGLGFIPGKVSKISEVQEDGTKVRVPHISWAPLDSPSVEGAWKGTPLEDVEGKNLSFYYVHSFHCKPSNTSNLLAESHYGGQKITAAIRHENLFGLQFHPERSGKTGQLVLNSFMAL